MNLKICHLSFSYPRGPELFKDLNAELFAGRSYALMGPSGVGKSTLAKLLGGHLTPGKGEIFLGEDLINLRPSKKILMIEQEDDLLPWFKVGKQLSLLTGKEESSILQILKELKLEHAFDKYPHQLSVGMKKRAGLARSILLAPQVLILDETLSSLENELRVPVALKLKDLCSRQGMILIAITHQGDEQELFDSTWRLENGG